MSTPQQFGQYANYPQQFPQGGPGPNTMQMQLQAMQAMGNQFPCMTPQMMQMRQQQGMSAQQMLGQLQAQAQNGGPGQAQAQAMLAAMRNRALQGQQQRFTPQPDVARVQQMGRSESPVNSSPRQPSYNGNMPPPPLPPTVNARFTPSPTQLQLIAAEQQRTMSNPAFQTMPPAQQQIQLTMIHHRMMSGFAQQPGFAPSAPSPSQTPFSSLPSHVRPTSAGRQSSPQPPAPTTPPTDFPFDPRLLTQFSNLNDPKWRTEMQARNPNMLAAIQQASLMVQQGKVSKDVLERMQQVVTTIVRRDSAPGIPVKEWETALKPTIAFTDIKPLPADPVAADVPAPEGFDPTFDGALPPITQVKDIRRWLDADRAYLDNFEKRKKNVQGKMMNWAKESDMGTPWWMMRKGEVQERRGPGCKIIWPEEKERERQRVLVKAGRRREIRFTPKQFKSMANIEDHVIPIRLDMEDGHFKLKDTFMWNCADTVVSPDLFAQSLCDDFNLPPHIFVPKISAAIVERIREYRDQVMPREPKRDGTGGCLEEEDVLAWKEIRDEVPVTVEEAMKTWEDGGEDMRILIKVDIMVGTQNLSDTFEWDLASQVTPEDFSLSYTAELGLNGEFATALAHDIHEQILVHKRCLFLVGHIGSGYIHDDEVRSSFLPPVVSAHRREDIAMSTFTPIFTTYTEEDVALIEREREKDSKRKRRATRARRGIILPDREPVKTHRTLLNPLGANGLAAPKLEEVVQHTGRRAAAIAAQANINLLAQDLPIPERAPPSPVPAPIKRGGRGMRGRVRASPMGGREETPAATPKRPLEEEPELPNKRARDTPDDVKPVVHGSVATSRSSTRSPEKRESTPRITLTMPRLDDSDSESSDSSENSEGEQPKRRKTFPQAPAAPPPLLASIPPGIHPPDWFLKAEAETKTRYPKDLFIVVPKGKVEPGQAVEWRLRCIDCPGKIYNLGPGESFANYEVHLKNRAHISNREKREAGL